MKTIVSFLLITIILTSCVTQKLPTNFDTFKGIIKTCVLDSTSLTNETNIKIISAETFVNNECPNKPKSYDYPLTWPSGIYFDFKTNKYTFQYNPIPYDKNLEFTDKNFKMSWNVDIGNLKYSSKKNTITLTSVKFNWTRTFYINISDKRDTISLTAIN